MNLRDNLGSSVANREKVYCGNAEYQLIYDWLSDKPDIKDNFIDVFMMKKLHTYMFNLRCIAPNFRHEYIRSFSGEFAESYRMTLCGKGHGVQRVQKLNGLDVG